MSGRAKARPVNVELYRCPLCQYRTGVARPKRMRVMGHIKHLWCPFCAKYLPFIRIR